MMMGPRDRRSRGGRLERGTRYSTTPGAYGRRRGRYSGAWRWPR